MSKGPPERRQGRFYLAYGADIQTLVKEQQEECLLVIKDKFDREKLARAGLDEVDKIDTFEKMEALEELCTFVWSIGRGLSMVQDRAKQALETVRSKCDQECCLSENEFMEYFKATEMLNFGLFSYDFSGIFPQNVTCDKEFANTVEGKNEKRLLGKFLARNICSQWQILERNVTNSGVNDTLLDQASSAIQMGGQTSAKSIMTCVKTYIGHHHPEDPWTSSEDLQGFLKLSYSSIFDFRKNEMFWPAIESWIQTCFSNPILERNSCSELLRSHGQELLDESEMISGLAAILSRRLDDAISNHNVRIMEIDFFYCKRPHNFVLSISILFMPELAL